MDCRIKSGNDDFGDAFRPKSYGPASFRRQTRYHIVACQGIAEPGRPARKIAENLAFDPTQ
jgi:hypothetical protein